LSASIFLGISPIILVVFIVAMSVVHTFIDFIPSIYLGAPQDGTELSILPGHELLKEGKAHEAVLITLLGSLIAVFLIILLSPLLIFSIPKLNLFVKPIIPFLLIAISIFLVGAEGKNKKFSALFVFILTGILGVITLNLELKEPLLPLLTGLFGASSLIISIKQKTKIPEQKISSLKKIEITKKELISSGIFSTFFSSVLGFLPALGSGQIAVISSSIKKINNKQFLFSLGLINPFMMILSFLAIYTINKGRTGSAVFIGEILGKISPKQIILILIISLISGILAFIIGIKLSKFFAKNIGKINYSKISIFVLIFLLIIVTIFSGFLGAIIFIISTLTGIYSISSDVRRIQMMGCLLIQTILLYLF
ncbi:MAG: tripartite tricarboxylate transporter permease, partial [Candidatus Pacearchaeota archaeon]